MTSTTNGHTAWWAKFVLVGGCLALLLLALAPLGYRLGLLATGTAVMLLPGMGAALGAVVLVVALVGLVLVVRRQLVAERLPLLIGAVLALVVVGNLWLWYERASSVPPIHNISTDLEDPPQFSALVGQRGDNVNPLEFDAERLAPLMREAYPELGPLDVPLPPAEALARAEAVAEAMGWEVVAVDADAGRLEASVSTRFYGFTDDVVVRVRGRPDGGSRIDLRSVSRVGRSDLGANAARIRAFQERYRQ